MKKKGVFGSLRKYILMITRATERIEAFPERCDLMEYNRYFLLRLWLIERAVRIYDNNNNKNHPARGNGGLR